MLESPALAGAKWSIRPRELGRPAGNKSGLEAVYGHGLRFFKRLSYLLPEAECDRRFLQSPRLEQGVGGVHMPQCRSVQIGITGDTGKLCGQAFSGEKETAVRPKRPRTGWDEERFC